MDQRLPLLAIVLGIVGLVPFLGCGLAALAPVALDGERGALALVAYGATVLSFLGGVHWGFALGDTSGRGDRPRLGLGVIPPLLGWVALLLVPAVSANAGIGLLVLGFIGTVVVEERARRAGLMPLGYMRLRYALSAVVLLVLVLVVLLRLIDAHIAMPFTY
jgi:hypothetical protein